MKDKFKKDLNKYELDEDSLSNIKSNIYTKYKKHQRTKKIILSVVTCFFIVVSSLGIVYADEIKETVNKLILGKYTYKTDGEEYNSFVVITDAEKKLNYDSTINEEKCHGKLHYKFGDMNKCYEKYSKDEIKKELGVDLLSSNKNKFYLLRLKRNSNNKISYVTFKDININDIDLNKEEYKDDELYIESSIIMKTKYYEVDKSDELYKLGIPKDAKEEKYYIKSLKVTASIVEKNQYITKSETGRIVTFLYDDIIYIYYFESLTNNEKIINEQIKDFLENLSY